MANVPFADGVPAILRDALDLSNPVQLLIGDVISLIFGSDQEQWGIFLDGELTIAADSVVALEYREAWVISDFQLEEGAFENYDKVQTPFSVKVRLSCGGDLAARSDFFASIDAVMGDLNRYDVVTPEKVYTSVNFERQDYRRTASSGAGLVSVDLWLTQVSVTAQSAFSDTQAPSGAAQTNNGTVQPEVTKLPIPDIPGTSVATPFPGVQ